LAYAIDSSVWFEVWFAVSVFGRIAASGDRAFRSNSSASLRSACGISAAIPCAANRVLVLQNCGHIWLVRHPARPSLRDTQITSHLRDIYHIAAKKCRKSESKSTLARIYMHATIKRIK
jgi:hypothetical protein